MCHRKCYPSDLTYHMTLNIICSVVIWWACFLSNFLAIKSGVLLHVDPTIKKWPPHSYLPVMTWSEMKSISKSGKPNEMDFKSVLNNFFRVGLHRLWVPPWRIFPFTRAFPWWKMVDDILQGNHDFIHFQVPITSRKFREKKTLRKEKYQILSQFLSTSFLGFWSSLMVVSLVSCLMVARFQPFCSFRSLQARIQHV